MMNSRGGQNKHFEEPMIRVCVLRHSDMRNSGRRSVSSITYVVVLRRLASVYIAFPGHLRHLISFQKIVSPDLRSNNGYGDPTKSRFLSLESKLEVETLT